MTERCCRAAEGQPGFILQFMAHVCEGNPKSQFFSLLRREILCRGELLAYFWRNEHEVPGRPQCPRHLPREGRVGAAAGSAQTKRAGGVATGSGSVSRARQQSENSGQKSKYTFILPFSARGLRSLCVPLSRLFSRSGPVSSREHYSSTREHSAGPPAPGEPRGPD